MDKKPEDRVEKKSKKRTFEQITANPGLEVIYFSDNGTKQFRKQFFALTEKFKPPYPFGGGVTSEASRIILPDNSLFHCLSYHTDISGWRQQIEKSAEEMGALVGKIEGDRFSISNGRSFALSECKIEID